MTDLYAGIEAGGTKFVAGVARADLKIIDRWVVPTTTPTETIASVNAGFLRHGGVGAFAGIGIGTFGPADINPGSPHYGSITSTPKPGWQMTDILGAFRDLAPRAAFHTDVGLAGLGEVAKGAAADCETCAYLTVGTGVGGAFVRQGQLIDGLGHSEIGHVMVHRHPEDEYPGHCPFHGDCLEGMASGPAIIDRWGCPLNELPAAHQAHDIIATYIAQACRILTYAYAPHRLVLGGGVMKTPGLLARVRAALPAQFAGYAIPQGVRDDFSDYIVPPALGDDAGLIGALIAARRA